MIVRLSRGWNAQIEPLFLVFTNKERNYPILGVPDSSPEVAYRTRPKGWIDTVGILFSLSETLAISVLPNGHRRHLWVDNCSGHNQTVSLSEVASVIRTDTHIHYFPHDSIHPLQL